jgi:hypothetical protein
MNLHSGAQRAMIRGMASREFTDSKGTVWRVWDVTPTHLHPVTRAEEYMEPWAGGWLAFESDTEKRRLVAPYPSRWTEYDVRQLETLCNAADVVAPKRVITPTGQKMATVEAAAEQDERARAERTFMSPRGRQWTVRIHECADRDGRNQTVLRFTAGDSVVDLKDFPADWKELERADYALLLLDAEPPRRLDVGKGLQRRRADRPED